MSDERQHEGAADQDEGRELDVSDEAVKDLEGDLGVEDQVKGGTRPTPTPTGDVF